jgi:signal transduction histidine kinase
VSSFSALLLTLVLILAAEARAQLTRAVEVRELPYERALEKLPVTLMATVSFVESQGTVFVEDETAGTHLHLKNAPLLKAGDRVRAEGVTMPGLYLPGVTVTRLEVLDPGAAPRPTRATFEDLAAGRFHYQLVELEGLGRRLTQIDENRSVLRLLLGGRLLEVRVDGPPGAAPEVVDARLRVVGLAAGGINDRRQLVFPYLRVAGWDHVSVLEPARPPQTLEPVPIGSLLRFGTPDLGEHRVRIRGATLAAFADGRVFLRDLPNEAGDPSVSTEPGAARAIGVKLVAPEVLTSGAVVDAVGFPVMDRFSATLADAYVETLGQPPVQVEPVPAKPEDLVDGTFDSDLVTLSATLLNLFRTAQGHELELDAGEVNLRAILPATEPDPDVATGSLLKLTGICQVESSTDKGFRSRADRAVLLLRGRGDLLVLREPSWWNAERLGLALVALAGLVMLGLVWIGLLRRQVARQAAALSAGVAQKAALEERQRIAREFHDTLEQELAGLSLRLDAAVSRPLEEKAKGLLETSRQLVKRVQAEARNLVADLRADPTVTADLGAAMRELARRVTADDLVKVELHLQEDMPPLPAHVVHHLRMIAQEAITNALKHANAALIVIELSLNHGVLRLAVRDNGPGTNGAHTSGKLGHFGCMGIRERARKLGGEVEWLENPGGGTCVEVRLTTQTQ